MAFSDTASPVGGEHRAGMNATFGDPWVLGLSAGFIVLFVAFSIYDVNLLSSVVSAGFAWTAQYLGTYFSSSCC
jgi:hypothetical protein